ncbi:Cwf15/Cwc15 cell cycle control protein [Cystobasidium minutum MCA 4210]|uniref:Cwf15/Cwc15 cell cycle control protein n=1 Tax=Cystobasidium minutum MCA 4210 TaxID=1397322 RepID=UPI0034CFA9DC|eukprot:jgi/Rhomi1/166499/fgenesh1_kg.2_\
MSTAHRPTWAPAQARDVGSGSKVISVRDVSSHTKLKFRQPGQGTASENTVKSRRDLKAELAKAERIAERKRKGITAPEEEDEDEEKKPAAAIETAPTAAGAEDDEQAAKRRKLIEEAVALDRDDDSDDEEEAEEGEGKSSSKTNGANGKTDIKGKGKATADNDDDDDESEDDSSDEEEDDEDETAELLRELEKIKRERAEEKERQERERAASDAISAEEQAALGNPLLNLQAALSGSKSLNSPGGYSNASSASSFAVKKRWDDDVIFKNQAVKSDEPKKEFVNDLIRTQFHRRFLQRYIA